MTAPHGRDAAIGAVLDAIVSIGRELASARKSPFEPARVTATQMDALFVLAHSRSPVTPGLLATRLGVTPGAVTQLVDALRHEGLVEQVAHPHDARSRLLRLTAGAAAAVGRFEADVVAGLRPRFDALSEAELAQLVSLLARVEAP